MTILNTSGKASRPNGGGKSTSPHNFLQINSAVESSFAAKSNIWTSLPLTTNGYIISTLDTYIYNTYQVG